MTGRARVVCAVAGVLATMAAFAFQPVPKESAKALGVTRGKSFSAGAVFVNGKYVEPPYVIERWGTGIRINSIPVTGQIIDWSEFIKTQSGAKAATTEAVPAPTAEPTEAAKPVESPAPAADVDESSLDDLFDDNPKPKKAAGAAKRVAKPKPVPTVVYSLEGDFVPNEASKKLVRRINARRTSIDKILRSGGFICFGDAYARVTGDARTLQEMLEKLPELLQHAEDEKDFSSKVRAAHMIYLNEVLCADLYRNRTDYRKLKELRKKIKEDRELDRFMGGFPASIF